MNYNEMNFAQLAGEKCKLEQDWHQAARYQKPQVKGELDIVKYNMAKIKAEAGRANVREFTFGNNARCLLIEDNDNGLLSGELNGREGGYFGAPFAELTEAELVEKIEKTYTSGYIQNGMKKRLTA